MARKEMKAPRQRRTGREAPLYQTNAPDGAGWLAGKAARKVKAGKRFVRQMHKAGKVRSYSIPDYSTGDALVDAVQASIARDILAMMPAAV